MEYCAVTKKEADTCYAYYGPISKILLGEKYKVSIVFMVF